MMLDLYATTVNTINSKRAPLSFDSSFHFTLKCFSLVGRFEELGSVADRPERGAHRNIRSEDNVETVRQSVADDPSVSTRRRSSQLERHCVRTTERHCVEF
ncbi:hypothetical protein TNIN_169841 [Trichonephila inaurata madagascariensis]|uniref:Uncharacterized protein n=1 Tax=Trichonephila inaurata madagascariensis TaxID=2747483 RepID=A0A8X6YRA4_9ARAC|nr:hypothetical protein TNIN_169841 [Trichonephila inaurata madagascariensis]